MAIRIGIAGIAGRMGKLLAEEVAAAGAARAGGSKRGDDPAALFAASDVVIDFTHASAAIPHARAAVAAGKPLVLGSSGLSAEQEATVAEAARQAPIVYAANFAPGVNLFLAIAERMAAALPAEQYDAEIVEMHHRQKVDAPSGTAVALGRAVARGRGTSMEEAGIESGRDGHTGPRKTGAIGFAALRGGQVVGEHSLLFAAASEHIILTHKSFDRRVYATGAVRAALWLQGRAPGLYDMKHVLGMG
ncbi:4-hydroxy-tetrahydrodipicolinate reductase [Siccirubricoccus sp. KC 17139]|uniref:4-hydroxy-tetrahydrodipicolinate reductase n=1 Tax=Siccirubricoccus soli TaxID=2899147 RepID=A0ABT1DCV7_9PROT|nr:4-hydroxy-tetrahydrodipicolinate reductase [Siccirubricoccus soli]MCO6419772.1 4-hydroxy-tetrahydrodipicolinate reductase [Siccirubricoccus soli]MCP2685907.1 4-hydroxy-tetrahydrodipicolinate reductase [Siccirubricoccus soli]